MKRYSILLGAGLLLLLVSCNKEERLEPTFDQINLERVFHEVVNDSTDINDDWNKHRYPDGEESQEELTNGS